MKVEEGARSAIFLNAAREKYVKTKVDGCLLNNVLAADFVVTQSGKGSVIVELKGTDVERAVKQVAATIEFFQKCEAAKQKQKMAGLVVCSRYPRFDTKLQRLSSEFTRKYKVPLHVVSKNDEFEMDRVLSFGGPK
ncbi:hypothetical protein [Chiayiivirga flava]|uniref:DUF91 domain-containing protein n=1 Tax=Chiayiivirga flava TaxID=659595 RepID=A0A7W8D6D1_9GAMM|nr:hypothetical protein [Chiayiivirga flava]MBB5208362.1 hypothetical protein [Chiayiivirga flava]